MKGAVRIDLSPTSIVLLVLGAVAVAASLVFAGMSLGRGRALSGPANAASAEGAKEHEGEHEDGKIVLSEVARKNAQLEVVTAGPGVVNVTRMLPGEVSVNQDTLAHVTPRVAGVAREVKKQLGDVVQQGDVLATLDSRELADSQREFLGTKERLALAQVTFARAQLLQKENISSEKDFVAARQALAEAQIEHRSAAQKLQAIGGKAAAAGAYALVAPSAGTIIEKHLSVGEVVGTETRAFTIADLSKIWVNVTVYAKDLALVAAGQTAEVHVEGIEEPARGPITYVGQVVGEQTRSAIARVVLLEPGPAWRPGLFATAEVVVDTVHAAVVVNDEAIQRIGKREVVFVEHDDGFEVRSVELGRKAYSAHRTSADVVEIASGLAAGERYVAKNSFILKAELGKSEAGHED